MRYNALRFTKCMGFCIAFLVGGPAFAQSSTKITSPQASSTYKPTKTQKSSEDLTASFGLDLKAIAYTEPSSVDGNSQQQIQAEMHLKQQGSFFTETDLYLGTFTEANSVYYAAPQAYVGIKGSSESSLTVGRKLENLSFADSFFNFGLMQSYSTQDNIEFTQGGLTGFSGHLSSGSMGVMASFNPIFIPNQGPQINAENGQIISSSRWAQQPPSKFKFGDQFQNINYAINDYKITDIISHGGYMLNAYAGGSNKQRPVLVVSYGKKPINEVALSRDTYGNIANFEGYVFLTPTVLRHEVQSADLNLDYENIKTTISYLADSPENIAAKDLEVMQKLSPLSIVSFYTSIDLKEVLGKKFEAYAAAAIIEGGEIKDVDSQGKDSIFTVSNSRTQFKRPLKLGVKSDMFYIYNNALEADVNLTYDQQLKGSLLSAKLKYETIKNMYVSVGADIIGVENELPADEQGNFLDQYKANDRFYGGIKYVF
ncbi:MAG: hypothetical protein ABL930_08780 [Pseudobdellovibrio sp.]